MLVCRAVIQADRAEFRAEINRVEPRAGSFNWSSLNLYPTLRAAWLELQSNFYVCFKIHCHNAVKNQAPVHLKRQIDLMGFIFTYHFLPILSARLAEHVYPRATQLYIHKSHMIDR